MTRIELLQLLLAQARSNGFHFRRWYVGWLGVPWEGVQKAVDVLSHERRYYALLFSRDFAESFWKSGSEMTLQMPARSFQRRLSNGTIGTVHRKQFTRRRTRPDAWRYHLRQMAAAEDPLRYIRRFLRVEDDLEAESGAALSLPENSTRDPRFIIDEEDLLID